MRGVVSRRGVFAAAAVVVCPRMALAAAATFPDFIAPGAEKLIAFGGDDLAISAYPLTSPQDQKLYFGLDLGAAGVLPIWLSISNRSSTTRYLLDADDIRLAYGQAPVQAAERSRSTVDDTGGAVVENVAAVGMAAGPIGLAVSLPILMMSGNQIARQDDVRRNLMVRQLYSKTLAPGQSAAGFVYCKVAKTSVDLSQLRLSLRVRPVPAPPGAAGTVFQTALALQAPSAPSTP
ncbi:hypothetical protein ACO2Q3_12315 [Caulobacter sp. KR2-114]|uniref:hypothetical protein n=1 Tax=Caulobacter sp. KR2-114 TaxID=3400912 RepID=UPI003C08D43C